MHKVNGIIYGFIDENNVISLNSEKPNTNTPIYLFGLLWLDKIRESLPELYLKGIELILKSHFWDDVKNDPENLNLSYELKVNNALACAIANKGERINRELGLGNSLFEWRTNLRKDIGANFGIENITVERISTFDLDTFTSIAASELLGGEKL